MDVHHLSRLTIEQDPLPGRCALICMADSPEQLAVVKDSANVVARLNLIFNDATDGFQSVSAPTVEDARKIVDFVDSQQSGVSHLVMQCEVGVGRSQAVAAALMKLHGADPNAILQNGTYNRLLYQLLLEQGGLAPDPEPLVSMAVRVKYSPDRVRLLFLSFQRQRYENWEIVAVTDGPNVAAASLVEEIGDPRIRLIQTQEARGRWGHPYRQVGLDACRGEFIGMSNDDNYYVPGYLEQMMFALADADLAMCYTIHSYLGWRTLDAGGDLGCWIARASLVRQLPWSGEELRSDQDYIAALKELAKDRVNIVHRPLFVHN